MAEHQIVRPEPYDPLDYENLARSVVGALMERPLGPIPPKQQFAGAGVYAIYYAGDIDWYAAISRSDSPIYVGKAVPAGRRKGMTSARVDGRPLHRRLAEHAASIDQAENLTAADFGCRYLVLEPVWIALAERFLIERFGPVWNTVVDGFGNHPQGKYRSTGKRSRWDVLHPGRPWAATRQVVEKAEDILREIAETLSG